MKRSILNLAVPLVLVAGCAVEKTSNPLSPNVAGPIAGVNISAPALLEPGQGAQISGVSQPVTLLIENSASNGPRPLNYLFEIATDAGFTNKVFTRADVQPGTEGRTSLRLSDALTAGRLYYWRARAQDGANTGPYSTAMSFNLFVPVGFDKPTALSPVNNEKLTTARPQFRLRNAPHVGTPINVSYSLELSTTDSFATRLAVWEFNESPGESTLTSPIDLLGSSQLFWRVRAYEGGTLGPWSDTAVFRPVTPVSTPTPGGGGGTGGAPFCGPPYPTTGPAIAACVERQYSDHTTPVGSLAERDAQMTFLRDRIIEVGICAGLDLALNRKSSGAMSIDALVYRHGGIDDVIDVGFQYDTPSQPLHLQWITVNGPAGYVAYSPRPSCR
jgi:hypothetical protein